MNTLPTLATHPILSLIILSIFIITYALVMIEEWISLKKSKPVLLGASLIWGILAWQAGNASAQVAEAFRHSLTEYTELFLFLLVAMTYINAIKERGVFDGLCAMLSRYQLSWRGMFWASGGMAFLLSPLADNLTTALFMGALVLTVAKHHRKFACLACINIVVAANAGGVFSPFGDVTTLMVWQKNVLTTNGHIGFFSFFHLALPALVNWLVPAVFMSFSVPKGTPSYSLDTQSMQAGAVGILLLFFITIALAVIGHHFLQLPPVFGMLSGLSLLHFYAYYLKQRGVRLRNRSPYNVFASMVDIEWDTLLFFYGVMLCVAGLSLIGLLHHLSSILYQQSGVSYANIMVGLISAVVDNVPVMFAVLTMMPSMSSGQWLLVTLTTGVGGSLLAIGSAAGVALLGQAKGSYSFNSHLRWFPAIALGFVASIIVHFFLNQSMF